jgi:Txe/YoeB family toxin of Txe-Axe toxin-antitoxin module
MIIAFDQEAFENFQAWAGEDNKIFARICSLIKDMNPYQIWQGAYFGLFQATRMA